MLRVKSGKKLILLLVLAALLFGAVLAYLFRGDLIYFLCGEEAYNAHYGLDEPMPQEFYDMLNELPVIQIDTNDIILPNGMMWADFNEHMSRVHTDSLKKWSFQERARKAREVK